MMDSTMMNWMNAWGWLGMTLALLFWLSVIGLIVTLVWRAARGGRTPTASALATEDRALATLRERYARGEIDRTEYDERRTTLAAADTPRDSAEAGRPPARARRTGPWLGGLIALLALSAVLAGTVAARTADQLPARPAPAARSMDSPFMGAEDPGAPYDLRFIDEMIMHHQGAIMSARMMIGNSARPELRDLARRIITGQQRQIEQMRAWRQQWYPNAAPPPMGMDDMMGGGMMGGSMMGGDQSDRMFLRMMIPHHQLAIDLAEGALKNAEHEELKGLAREIVADQSAEIAEMEGYLEAWYGEGSTRGAAEDCSR